MLQNHYANIIQIKWYVIHVSKHVDSYLRVGMSALLNMFSMQTLKDWVSHLFYKFVQTH